MLFIDLKPGDIFSLVNDDDDDTFVKCQRFGTGYNAIVLDLGMDGLGSISEQAEVELVCM